MSSWILLTPRFFGACLGAAFAGGFVAGLGRRVRASVILSLRRMAGH